MSRNSADADRVRQSVIDAHRADQAHSADIQRAYLRFSWARRRPPRRLPGLRWLVAGVAIGVGVASAATLIPALKGSSLPPAESAHSAATVARRPPVRHGAVGTARAQATVAEPIPELPTPAPVESPAPPVSAPPLSPARPRASATPAPSQSDWQRAAGALRSGDLAEAEAALSSLEKSGRLLDRQAAELARAQLLVGQGRQNEALGSLQRLAREGGSPVIRSQAASTLRDLEH